MPPIFKQGKNRKQIRGNRMRCRSCLLFAWVPAICRKCLEVPLVRKRCPVFSQ